MVMPKATKSRSDPRWDAQNRWKRPHGVGVCAVRVQALLQEEFDRKNEDLFEEAFLSFKTALGYNNLGENDMFVVKSVLD